MTGRYSTLLFSLLFTATLAAQNHDFQWIFGAYWYGQNTTETQNISIDFRDQPATVHDLGSIDMIFYFKRTAIADATENNLLFYSNGCEIKDRYGDIMPRGDTLTPGAVHDNYCDPVTGWNTYPGGAQSMLALPRPKSEKLWDLFHKKVYINAQGIGVSTTYNTVIDMNLNGGRGEVIEKSVVQDTLSSATHLTACRSADLSAWWLHLPDWQSNHIKTYRLDSSGMELYHEMDIGIATPSSVEGDVMARFSPDGSVYATYSVLYGLQLFDFDRITGLLSNPRFYSSTQSLIDSSFWSGIEFSPSGRFLYLATGHHLKQVDLDAPNPEIATVTVATVSDSSGLFLPRLNRPQLGPDCRLYVFCISCSSVAIVHRPDELGAACMVEQQAIETPTPYFRGLPIYPKYRMKALGDTSSICAHVTQTVFISDTQEPGVVDPTTILLYPNPASHDVRVVFSRAVRDLRWELIDAVGRKVSSGQVAEQAGQEALVIPVADLPAGAYWLSGWHGKGERWRKLVRVKR